MDHFYEFAAPDGVFRVRSEIDISGPLAIFVGRWPWRVIEASDAVDVEVARRPGGYRLRLCALPEAPLETEYVAESASAALDMLTRLTMQRLGSYAVLHAGSALIDGRLVLFPGQSEAGKSTLALQLAARGHVLGGDDRLLVGPLRQTTAGALEGVLLGLNARVRLPLHPRAGAAFARFIAERRLPAEALPTNIGFIAPRPTELAAFGQRAPLAALVLPRRTDSGGVSLESASFSDIMRLLLEEFHAAHWHAAELTEAARTLAQALPRYVLRFDDSAAAAAAVEDLARSGFGDLAR